MGRGQAAAIGRVCEVSIPLPYPLQLPWKGQGAAARGDLKHLSPPPPPRAGRSLRERAPWNPRTRRFLPKKSREGSLPFPRGNRFLCRPAPFLLLASSTRRERLKCTWKRAGRWGFSGWAGNGWNGNVGVRWRVLSRPPVLRLPPEQEAPFGWLSLSLLLVKVQDPFLDVFVPRSLFSHGWGCIEIRCFC